MMMSVIGRGQLEREMPLIVEDGPVAHYRSSSGA